MMPMTKAIIVVKIIVVEDKENEVEFLSNLELSNLELSFEFLDGVLIFDSVNLVSSIFIVHSELNFNFGFSMIKLPSKLLELLSH